MSAYIVFQSTINNPEAFAKYAKAVPQTLKPYQGIVVVKGKKNKVIAGEHDHVTLGVIEFPDLDHAYAWYSSTEYQRLLETRDQAASMTVVSYEAPVA